MIPTSLQVLHSCGVIYPKAMGDITTLGRILNPTQGKVKLEGIPRALANWRMSHLRKISYSIRTRKRLEDDLANA